MTSESAEYYRILLLMGYSDEFYRDFDEALETEDPLSDLILSLCDCASDLDRVCTVLSEYAMDHPYDAQAVCDQIKANMLSRFLRGELTRSQVVTKLYDLVIRLHRCGIDPWTDLVETAYALELSEDGILFEEAFNECFDAWYLRGERLDVWQVQSRWYEKKIRQNRKP